MIEQIILAEKNRASIKPVYPNVGAMVDALARKYGDRTAFACFEDNEYVSYKELDLTSNQVARGLAKLNIKKGTRVATMLQNCKEYPITWVALAKLGAIMVPIPTSYTSSELQHILDDCGADMLIIDREHLPLVSSIHHDRIRIVVRCADESSKFPSWQSVQEASSAEPLPLDHIGPDDPLGFQYTSGSTGSPKGCVVSHDYWMLLGRAMAAEMRVPVSRILAPNCFNYMTGRGLLLTSMELGGTLYLARRPSTSRFLDWIDQLQIDWCFFPQLVLKQPRRPNDRFTTLKQVGLGSYSTQAHMEFHERFGVPSQIMFGMTEVGAALAGDVHDPEYIGSGRLGTPMLGRAVAVRDEAGKAVAPGGNGELWIAGPAMMSEYHNRPDATAEVHRGPWFRTGDLVRLGEDGHIYFVRRIKDVVRRSNENISAREVEDVAKALRFIEDAAVIPVPDDIRGEEVKIFVQIRPGMNAGADAVSTLAEHFGQSLAAFKRPRYYAFCETLPRTPSLKVAKRDLRFPPFSNEKTFDIVAQKWS